MPNYVFCENNSGGSWWLTRADYEALFAAGWKAPAVEGKDAEPWLGGDDTPYGWRHATHGEFASLREAVESFERATKRDFFEEGCRCCGAPFSIHTDHDDRTAEHEYISGDDAARSRPW